LDIGKRLMDYRFYPPTVYFPLIVKEAMMIEPTETETPETLERFAAAMNQIDQQSIDDPEIVRGAPHFTPVGRLDETAAARRPDLIVKVKEPLPEEYPLIRPGQVLLTYFHFAADEGLTRAMLERGAVCIAYETLQLEDGSLPLLTPMSEIAGRMAIQEGAKYLERPMEGRGILLSGVPGVPPANIVILGGGIVGTNAAKIAAGIGARVTLLDINLDRLRYLDDVMPKNVVTLFSDRVNIRRMLTEADLLIGA